MGDWTDRVAYTDFLDYAEHVYQLCFEHWVETLRYCDEIARLNMRVAELELEAMRLRAQIDSPTTPMPRSDDGFCCSQPPTPRLKKTNKRR